MFVMNGRRYTMISDTQSIQSALLDITDLNNIQKLSTLPGVKALCQMYTSNNSYYIIDTSSYVYLINNPNNPLLVSSFFPQIDDTNNPSILQINNDIVIGIVSSPSPNLWVTPFVSAPVTLNSIHYNLNIDASYDASSLATIQVVNLTDYPYLCELKENRIYVDLDNQEYQIPDVDVDVRTIRVSVNSVYWNNHTNDPLQTTNENSQIFFVVKKGKYYYIKFGKDLQSQNINSIGKSVTGADIVKLSYVISSGLDGNGVKITELVSNGSKTIPAVLVSSTTSSGGYDTPDLNYLKYVGPRYYGYQGLITKSDYEAAIISSGYLSDYTDPQNKIAVFDGQTHNNNYGKIYFSML
jgi:hypothetical protein